MFQSFLVLTLFLWHYKNSFVPFRCLYCAKAWVISFNSIWFWLWLCDEVLHLELLCDPSFWHIWSNLGSYVHEWKMDDAKWNHSISEAKYNESWKSMLLPTLDPESSTASDEIFNHFEWLFPAWGAPCSSFMVIWAQLLQANCCIRCTQRSRFFFFFFSKVCFRRNVCANDVNFKLFTQSFMVFNGACMHCITHL